ncbi:hypothetical protein C3K47_13405 [Solitalea longa]|uniref:Outer membrane protein beta-barrel domain-containing protein n=1 Tax=Solitalea longa TaxID=2079460 RepID=A0A2S4ZZI3_9SPHI|nr:hypothetical protein [Solitalea longa]POY35751.1 hypothetical protein C3K47_13405 [Solitalea longa]
MKNTPICFITIIVWFGSSLSIKSFAQTQGNWYLSGHVDAGKTAKFLATSLIHSALNLESEEEDPDETAKFRFGFDAGYQFKVKEQVSVDAGINIDFYNIRNHPTYAYVIEDDFLFKQRNTAFSAEIRPTYFFGHHNDTRFFLSLGVKMTKCFTRVFYSELSYEDESVLPRYLSKSNAISADAPVYVHLVPAVGFNFGGAQSQSFSVSLEWEKTRWDNSFNNLNLSNFGLPSNYQFESKGIVSMVLRLGF